MGDAPRDDLIGWAHRRDIALALQEAREHRLQTKRALRRAPWGQRRRARRAFELATTAVLELETAITQNGDDTMTQPHTRSAPMRLHTRETRTELAAELKQIDARIDALVRMAEISKRRGKTMDAQRKREEAERLYERGSKIRTRLYGLDR